MSPAWLGPAAVTPAQVRRLPGGTGDAGVPVQRVEVPVVPAARVVARQVQPVDLRLLELQVENDQLRAELAQLRSA